MSLPDHASSAALSKKDIASALRTRALTPVRDTDNADTTDENQKKGPLVWINAGELSGDMHGAALLAALRRHNPHVRCRGMGGPYLREAGQDASLRVEDLSVMGGTEVLGYLPRIFKMLRQIKRELTAAQESPNIDEHIDALIVIDAPDFNFRIIKMAHKLNIPVYYYISPKIWAWRTGRVHFIKKHVRRVFSILPFEVEFYRHYDMDVDYVGNPLVDMIQPTKLDHIQPQANRIGLLPGSRRKELQSLLPIFGEAAALLLKTHPHLTFHCVRAPSMTREHIAALWPSNVPLEIIEPDDRYAFLRTCPLLMASSGTATLETALLRIPTLVTYVMSPISAWLAKRFIKVKYVALPNLILNKELFPELLLEKANSEMLAAKAAFWLDTPSIKEHIGQELDILRSRLGVHNKENIIGNMDEHKYDGAADRAANIILKDLGL